MPFAMRAAIAGNFGDTVHHEHGRFWQLGVALTEQLASGAFQEVVAIKARWILGHVACLPFVNVVARLLASRAQLGQERRALRPIRI
jgi:hypothetical protein